MPSPLRLAAVLAATLGVSTPVVAQQAAAPAPNRRIEGDWVRTDPDGSGSFGGLGSTFAPAVLTAAGVAARSGGAGRGGARGGGPGGRGAPPAGGAPNAVGVPYIVVQQPCGGGGGRGNGVLLLNPDSGGVHLIEHRDEVVFAGERGGVRHIFTDGRRHPDGWVPTPAGHSIGHYEGDVLVVETVGMTPAAVVAGGYRTPETKLTERFQVAPDGKTMTITYTWEDPKIYQKPHSYTYYLERMPPGSYAFEEWCDASDPIEQQSIVPPKQLP